MWNIFSALGDIGFAYAFSIVLTNIQDTLKSSPPENKVMKRASSIAILITTMFYMLCGLTGYAAFGSKAPGNMLTGFGFFEPFWLVDFANICIIIHLIGAYQVLCQPLFAFVESWSNKKWSGSKFITSEYYTTNLPFLGSLNINFFRLIAVLEDLKDEAAEQVDVEVEDEPRPSETDPEAAEPNSKTDGRRCGLCGVGTDGKPPKVLAQDGAGSANEAYCGSSASG